MKLALSTYITLSYLLMPSVQAQNLQVYNLQGNLLSTSAIDAPYLYTAGSLVLPLANTSNNIYIGRGNAGTAAVANTTFPASTLPQYLELDGRWYSINSTGFVSAFYLAGDFSIDAGSWSNCRQSNGSPLPVAVAPRLRLGITGGFANIPLQSGSKIQLHYLPSAEVWSMTSAPGVICDGSVPNPIDPIFKNGFEN